MQSEDSLAAAYARWRSSRIADVTERLEQELIFRLAGPLDGKRVLDIGSGDGTYALAASSHGARVTGIDASAAQIAAARERALRVGARVEFVVGDAHSLPFPNGAFDVVTAVTILCFVRDPSVVLSEMARVLTPDGRLVIGELNRWSAWAAWRRLRGWLGRPHWREARFRSAEELRALARAAGLRVECTQGAIFYPPLNFAARLMERFDAWLGRRTTLGAAFVAIHASRR